MRNHRRMIEKSLVQRFWKRYKMPMPNFEHPNCRCVIVDLMPSSGETSPRTPLKVSGGGAPLIPVNR